jgi:hypothetical protein
MANYNERSETGNIKIWDRSRQMVLDNPVDGPPQVTCYEYRAQRLPDGTVIEKSLGNLSYVMTDPNIEIPLIDPETFEPTAQTMTAGQIWLAMASVYLWLARQRDGIGS